MATRRYAEEEEPLVGGKDTLLLDEPPEVRSGFIQKVYGILFCQLLLTTAVAAPFVLNEGLKTWAKYHGGPLFILVLVANIVFLFVLTCPCGCEKNMRTYPTNYLLLGGFTFTKGILVGFIAAKYTAASVVAAFLLTAFLVGGLSLYAMTTKSDFTDSGGYLFAALLAFICLSFMVMFVGGPLIHKILAFFGILLFSMYLIYDTQMIMGKGELAIGVDDYVFAALQLYVDIVQIFIYMLQLFGDQD
jgi:FtsH-binding integral membrane protein